MLKDIPQWTRVCVDYEDSFSSFALGLYEGDTRLWSREPIWPTHWRPQTELLTSGLRERLDVVVSFELLNQQLPTSSLTEFAPRIDDHRTGVGVAFSCEPYIADLLHQIFRNDFEAFGYSEDIGDVAQPSEVGVRAAREFWEALINWSDGAGTRRKNRKMRRMCPHQ